MNPKHRQEYNSRAAILAESDLLRGSNLALPAAPASAIEPGGATMANTEHDAIRRTLSEVGGNRRLAAERLGIGVRTLYEKLKRTTSTDAPGTVSRG